MLFTVTVRGELMVPTGCDGKVRAEGEQDRSGRVDDVEVAVVVEVSDYRGSTRVRRRSVETDQGMRERRAAITASEKRIVATTRTTRATKSDDVFMVRTP
jgi:hypothetical protein